MPVKRTPHHDLKAIQAKFTDVDTLEITSKAARDAQKIGYSLEDIVDVVLGLDCLLYTSCCVKETARPDRSAHRDDRSEYRAAPRPAAACGGGRRWRVAQPHRRRRADRGADHLSLIHI